jgi:hypothetical protein
MLYYRLRYPISLCTRRQDPGDEVYFIVVSRSVRGETEIRIVPEILLLCRTDGEVRSIRDTAVGNTEWPHLVAEVTDCKRAT